MTAVWIPPVDRSKFMANMMASSLGAAVTMPVCGFLIEYFSWQSVFYVTGKISHFFSSKIDGSNESDDRNDSGEQVGLNELSTV